MGKFINQILPLMTTNTPEKMTNSCLPQTRRLSTRRIDSGIGFSYWRRRPRCLYQSSLEKLVAEIDGRLYAERDGLYAYPRDRLLGLYILLRITPAGNAALKAGSSNSPWEQNAAEPFCQRDGALHRSEIDKHSRQRSAIRVGSVRTRSDLLLSKSDNY